jgi:hypothetical protein
MLGPELASANACVTPAPIDRPLAARSPEHPARADAARVTMEGESLATKRIVSTGSMSRASPPKFDPIAPHLPGGTASFGSTDRPRTTASHANGAADEEAQDARQGAETHATAPAALRRRRAASASPSARRVRAPVAYARLRLRERSGVDDVAAVVDGAGQVHALRDVAMFDSSD